MSTRKRTSKAHRRWRQSKWLLWYFLSKEKCHFCDKPLIEGIELGDLPVTLHHLVGSQETDDMDAPAPIDELVPAHRACHKRHHLPKSWFPKLYPAEAAQEA